MERNRLEEFVKRMEETFEKMAVALKVMEVSYNITLGLLSEPNTNIKVNHDEIVKFEEWRNESIRLREIGKQGRDKLKDIFTLGPDELSRRIEVIGNIIEEESCGLRRITTEYSEYFKRKGYPLEPLLNR